MTKGIETFIDLPSSPRRRRSKTKTVLAIAGACSAIVVGYAWMARPVETSVAWSDDFDATIVDASRTGKPVLAVFVKPGCPFCWAMDRYTLSDASVERSLSRFAPVRVNAAAAETLAARYDIEMTPTFLIISPTGQLIDRSSGYQSAEKFRLFLKNAGALASSDQP